MASPMLYMSIGCAHADIVYSSVPTPTIPLRRPLPLHLPVLPLTHYFDFFHFHVSSFTTFAPLATPLRNVRTCRGGQWDSVGWMRGTSGTASHTECSHGAILVWALGLWVPGGGESRLR